VVDINTVLRIEKEVKKLGQEKEGQQSLKKTEVKLKKIDNEYESSLNSFMEKWGDKLGEEE